MIHNIKKINSEVSPMPMLDENNPIDAFKKMLNDE